MSHTFRQHMAGVDLMQRRACVEALSRVAHQELESRYPAADGYQLTEISAGADSGNYISFRFSLHGGGIGGRFSFEFHLNDDVVEVFVRPGAWFGRQADPERTLVGELKEAFNQYGMFGS